MSSVVDISRDKPAAVDLTEEYVAGGDRFWGDGVTYLEPISWGTGEPSADELDQMELDPEVASAGEFLVESALADGCSVMAGVGDKDPLFAKATEVTDAWQRSLENIDVKSFLSQMLSGAIPTGHKIAEVRWDDVDDTEDPDHGKYRLGRLAVKPRNAVRFVVDKYWNPIGIYAGPISGTEGGFKLFPMEKFVVLTLHKRDEDPRGRSLYRAARTAWLLKTRIPPQYYRFLDQLILPFFIGFLPPGADKRNELVAGKKTSAAQAMLDTLTKLKSMFAAVFAADSKVEVHKNDGTGEAFGTAYQTINREIRKAILLQELATSEGAHQARAASETHMSVLDYRVQSIRTAMATMLDDLAYRFTLYNYGARAAATISPVHSLGDSDRRDWTEEMNSYTKAWTSGWLKLANIPKFFASVNVELAEDWEERLDKVLSAPAASKAPGQPGEPDDDRDDDEKPSKKKAHAVGPVLARTPKPPAAWLRRVA